MFIFVVILFSSYSVLANENDCDCEVLQVEDPDGKIGYQNFTKQNGTRNGKPYYVSMQKNMISWNHNFWSYDKWSMKRFQLAETYFTQFFSFENKCEDVTGEIYQNRILVHVKSQCLRENNKCFATKEFSQNLEDGHRSKVTKLLAKNPCKFPFIHNNITYKSCTKREHDKFWCATTVNATDHKTSWGNCNDLCPEEEDIILKAGEVVLKPWHIKLISGIVVGILLITAFIICCICIKKKKKAVTVKNNEVAHKNAEARYSLDPVMSGNQARINSTMILNDQAEHLSYSGKLEIDESKFEIGKKIGGGSFGSVYEGTLPGQKIKVAVKSVKDSFDRSQVYALMCEIKVLDKLEKHLNLVNMIGACTSQHSTGKLWLLLEYCPCGDMKNFLHKNRDVFMQGHNDAHHKSLNMRIFIKWGYGIANGMEYLSSKKIMHGDLAARNILITNLDRENYLAKITDFGLSKAFYDKTTYAKQDRRNVPWKWMDVDFLETSIFTMSSDVWSFGVVCWEMLSIGRTPYAGGNANDTIKTIKAGFRLPPPDEISQFQWLVKCYNEVTQMCWRSNPKQRSSFLNLVQTFETYLTTEEKEDLKRLEQNTID